MTADPRFVKQNKRFWATIRTASEITGYTERGSGRVLSPKKTEIANAISSLELAINSDGLKRELIETAEEYFAFRAETLNTYVEPRLMDVDRVSQVFEDLKKKLRPTCPLPMNKQKGEKKSPNYLTGIINMIVEANIHGLPVDYDPRSLTTFTVDGIPVRTLSRRVDGAFPGTINPIALWEIKEYYYTTTFGSRVADGVYESLLDGMELEELKMNEGIQALHYLMVDSHYTWWESGRSYLCRVLDMLHMGYLDEVLFGMEVTERLPAIVRSWVIELKKRKATSPLSF